MVFNSAWRMGLGLGSLGFLLLRWRRLLFSLAVWRVLLPLLGHRAMLLSLAVSFSSALYLWSIAFVDVSVASILYDTWLVWFVALMALLHRGGRRWWRDSAGLFALLGVAFVGLAFVVVSERGSFLPAVGGWSLAFGVCLALFAGVASGMAAFIYAWGRLAAGRLLAALGGGLVLGSSSYRDLVLFGAVLGLAWSSLVGAGLNLGLGLAVGEGWEWWPFLVGLGLGAFLHAPASFILRVVNLSVDNLGVNAISYFAPVGGLLLLWLFALVGVARGDYLTLGVSILVAANLLIHFQRNWGLGWLWGYSSWLLAGAAVYLGGLVSWVDGVNGQVASVRSGSLRALARPETAMLLAAVLWAILPLIAVKTGGLERPFLFNGFWELGDVTGTFLILFLLFPRLLFSRAAWGALFRWPGFLILVPASLNGVQMALFVWSTHFVDVSVVVVLIELWPLMLILFLRRWADTGLDYRKNLGVLLPLLLVAFLAAGLTLSSQSAGVLFLVGWSALLGAVLALAAAGVGGLDAFNFRFGERFAVRMSDGGVSDGPLLGGSVSDLASLVLFGSLIGSLFSSVPGIASLGAGWLAGERVEWSSVLWWLGGAIFLAGGSNFLFRWSNLYSNNLGVNALGHFTPVLSIVLLGAFHRLTVLRPGLFLAGLAGVTAVNFVIQLGLEWRLAFRNLIPALWLGGAVALLGSGGVFSW